MTVELGALRAGDEPSGFTAGAVRPDGGALAAAVGEGDRVRVVAVGPDGAPDPAFGGGDGVVDLEVPLSSFASSRVLQVVLRPDGRAVLALPGPPISTPFARDALTLVGLTASGAPDRSFHGGTPYVTQLAVSGRPLALAPDGGLLVSGRVDPSPGESPSGDDRWVVARLLADGTPDPAFGTGGVTALPEAPAQGAAVAVTADGSIDAVGDVLPGVTAAGIVPGRRILHRLTPSGQVDPAFAGGQAVPADGPDGVPGPIEGADGSVLVLGRSSAGGTLTRLRADGTPDPAYGDGGSAVLPIGLGAVDAALLATPDGGLAYVAPPPLAYPPAPPAARVVRISPGGRVVADTTAPLGFAGGYEDPAPVTPGAAAETLDRPSLAALSAIGVRADGGLVLAGAAAAGHRGGRGLDNALGQEGALAALTPADQPDLAFGAAEDRPALRVRLAGQTVRDAARQRVGLALAVRTSGVGLVAVRVRLAGRTVADTVRAALVRGDQPLLVRLPDAARARLRKHPSSLLSISTTFRDLLGRDVRTTTRGRLAARPAGRR